ncbi:hypothetical protein [Microbacterium saperdae]|uniref:Uncharacterized protein n=1 Tax=Microbacterium saperdae TaxID=69368 RepID=A0A543BQU9_9MICO|nr:hypothetical protein [Microbacterium saperdae]TQL87205.1 hypothetical protein FB560_2872 [Microbacterium saperdae]GGM42109.1 hypothetical protein GCM10010489_11450 [Microbacterium saperdae]
MLQPLWVHADGVEILARPRDFPSVIEGLFVGPDGLNGWEDGGGDVRRESVERPASIGEFDLPVYEGPLVFSMEGHALAQSEQQLAVLRDRVTGVGYGGRRFKVAVGLQGRELWTWVRRGSKPTFRDTGRRGRLLQASFMLQFVAPIPRRYGQERLVPAGEAAVNRGNEEAVPRLLIGAGAGGYTVTGPGGRVITANANAPAAAHFIDFSTGGLFNAAGGRVPNAITVWQPWKIPPGLPGVVATISTSRSLTQAYPDTFN